MQNDYDEAVDDFASIDKDVMSDSDTDNATTPPQNDESFTDTDNFSDGGVTDDENLNTTSEESACGCSII